MKTKVNRFLIKVCCVIISLSVLIISPPLTPAYSQEPWTGIFFWPQANTNNDHAIFLNDFEVLAKALKAKGHNTIVFDMSHWGYHFTSDPRLNNYPYSPNWGFTAAECQRMAGIARANGMKVMVSLGILTHSVGKVFDYVYPEYMLAAKTWSSGVSYTTNTYVQYNGYTYKCIAAHTSSSTNAPPTSTYWATARATDTRDPMNKAGEAVVFKMIDELIDAFTVNNIKPEAFHIGGDELNTWYDNPLQSTGMTSAQIYAMAITNAFIHIKAKFPKMEVIMWSDMLDPYWNGSPANKNTFTAIDLIPKEMIIADWRYESNRWYRYDSIKEVFPSVNEFVAKGFRVWPTSWFEVKATNDLIWTGNMEQMKSGKIMGHLYSTWLGGIVPQLTSLLADPAYQVPDSVLTGLSATEIPIYRNYYRSIADSINATANLVWINQCRGKEYHCGTYPSCEDNGIKKGFYGNEFRSYYCSNNMSLFNGIMYPIDYAAYWKFNGDATDVTGRSNGTLYGATTTADQTRGQVAGFATSNAYVKVLNNSLINMGTGSMSLGCWFKAGASTGHGTLASKSHDLKTYSMFLHQDGRVLFYTNANNFFRYSVTGVNNRDNKWHHVMAVFDSSVPTINIYVDGQLSNGSSSLLDGTNSKTSTSDLLIGNHNQYGEYQFSGLIDDLVLFNRALSATEAYMVYLYEKPSLLYKNIELKVVK